MDKNKAILGGVVIVAIVAVFIIYKKKTKK